jgi:hypothetical protein
MNVSPFAWKCRLIGDDDFHRAANIRALHLTRKNQLGATTCANQIDLHMPVAEHMNMCRLMIVGEDDDTEAVRIGE